MSTGVRPPTPSDGPRYDAESASAALLRSTYQPYEDWSGIECPVPWCPHQYITDDGVAGHYADCHDRGAYEVNTER
jgi:hypothetical protein